MVEMGNLRYLIWMVLMLGLLVVAGKVAADVDWTDDLTDPADDVVDTGGTVIAFPGGDILSVSIAEEGEDINVTMVLAGEYDPSGTYTVSVSADDSDDTYDFTRMFFIGFMVSDPVGDAVDVEGNYSEDGKVLSWVVAKADIDAVEKLEIVMAMAMVMDITSGISYTDMAFSMGPGPGSSMPSVIDIEMKFEKLNRMVLTFTLEYEGEMAKSLREPIDENSDGTITAAEVSSFEESLNDDTGDDGLETNITLDGMDPITISIVYNIEGAEGPADSEATLKWSTIETIKWNETEDKDTHTYLFEDSGDDGFMGGDEQFPEEIDVHFKMIAPGGWKFDTKGWPEGLKDFVKEGDTVIEMDDAQIRASYNTTWGEVDSYVVKKEKDDDNGTPGFGSLYAIAAIVAVLVHLTRRRR
jgi:hypothetical protein